MPVRSRLRITPFTHATLGFAGNTQGSLRVLECCLAASCEERVQHRRGAAILLTSPSRRSCSTRQRRLGAQVATLRLAARGSRCRSSLRRHPRSDESPPRGARIAAEHPRQPPEQTSVRTRSGAADQCFYILALGSQWTQAVPPARRVIAEEAELAASRSSSQSLGFLGFPGLLGLSGGPSSLGCRRPIAVLEQLDADGVRAPASACRVRRWPVGAGRN